MPEPLEGEFILNSKPDEEVSSEEEKGHTNPYAAEGHTGNAKFYSNFCVYPKNVHFENQEKGEEIVLLVRRDLITNLPWMLTAVFLVFIPFFISAFPDLFTPFFQLSPTTLIITTLFYYLIVFGFILIEFTLWYFNVGLVTTKRIIDLDLSGILFKHVSETRLELIEDVSYSQVGSVRSVFNYGDVLMQTAGTTANFEFDRAPEPARIVRIIADMIGRKNK